MKHYILILAIISLYSCQKNKKPTYGKAQPLVDIHPGKKLMESKCYVCHNPNTSQSERIAPPMIAIKKHYISENTTKEEFIEEMQNWIKNPTKENVKMFGAVRKFGLMPKQVFSEDDIKQIATYMFENEIEKPKWFESHYNEERGKGKGIKKGKGMGKDMQKQQANSDFKNLPFAERGLKYALLTKQVLGKNLMGKIQKEGTIAALKFCNEKAYPLTDSMATYYNAKIKRVTDKPRNPNNKANKEEEKYITIFKNDIVNKKESEPIVVENSEHVNVYYPIKTNGMCLQCHGTPNKEIAKNTFSTIQKLYPEDKAIGYNINEIRGIWNVSFNK